DIQECPKADLAVVTLVTETVKALVEEQFIDFENQMKWKTDFLAQLLDKTSAHAQDAVIDHPGFLEVFGIDSGRPVAAGRLWAHIADRLVKSGHGTVAAARPELDIVLREGTLAQRIVRSLGADQSREHIVSVYRRLCDCLA